MNFTDLRLENGEILGRDVQIGVGADVEVLELREELQRRHSEEVRNGTERAYDRRELT